MKNTSTHAHQINTHQTNTKCKLRKLITFKDVQTTFETLQANYLFVNQGNYLFMNQLQDSTLCTD